jgi:hypothetical protein
MIFSASAENPYFRLVEFRKIFISVRSEEIFPVLTVELSRLPSSLEGKKKQ